ncbi:MAG: hypothetical protein C4320_08765, partial [Armatimonadota bacterium]
MRHLLLLMICAAASSPAAESRLVLLRQEGGFTLEFKNEGVSPLRVGETRLVLTLGAGAGRRELIAAQTFATDRTYQVEAEILPRRATIRVDGKLVGGVTVPFASGSGEIEVNIGEGEAIPVLNHLRVRTPVFTWDRPLPDAAPGLRLFAPAFPIAIGKAPLAPPIRIEAQVRFEPADPPGDLRTLLDRYGQLDAGTWLGKATEDEALRRKHLDEVAALERLLPPNPPAPTPASGAFRLVRQEARWNLISPEGDPMFFTGVRAVGETDATDW